MDNYAPSIFNDVIGPVMRGPSSSHVAAAARIGRLIRMSCPEGIAHVTVEFDPSGSLAESYHGHGSDMGLISGLLGLKLTDRRCGNVREFADQEGLEVCFRIVAYGAEHPNNYRMTVTSRHGSVTRWEAISTGGGMIELWKMDEYPISVGGGFYETFIGCCNQSEKAIRAALASACFHKVHWIRGEQGWLVNLKSTEPLPEALRGQIRGIDGVTSVMCLEPVLPTLSKTDQVPFRTAEEMLSYAEGQDIELWQLGMRYESIRGGYTEEEVSDRMSGLLDIMEGAVEEGRNGTEYENRILGYQSYRMKNNPLFPAGLMQEMIQNITAVMEVKSSMGVIIAAPTAGSCGCLPGTVIAAKRALHLDRSDAVRGLLAAGVIGLFIAEEATFSAEVAGCQAECGAASAMTAAAVVQMLGGTVQQCVDAASMALQNVTGLVCDPVGDRVEVPCLGKNVMAGSNAVASAAMALAGYDKVVPLDETIQAMFDIGKKLPLELRCTCGGLGKTKTSAAILERLKRKETENQAKSTL